MNVFFIGKWIKRLLVLKVCFLSSIIIIIIIRKKVFTGYSAVNIQVNYRTRVTLAGFP